MSRMTKGHRDQRQNNQDCGEANARCAFHSWPFLEAVYLYLVDAVQADSHNPVMRSRLVRILVLISMVVWYLGVVPCHARGRITLGPASADNAESCCSTKSFPGQN